MKRGKSRNNFQHHLEVPNKVGWIWTTEVELALSVNASQGVRKMSICLPGHQGLLISSDSLFIFEALCWFNLNFSQRHLLVPHLHSIQLRAQVLEWTLRNPFIYSILYNVHLLASYLGTMLLDDQLMNTGSHFNISLELKKAIWPQLAFLNVFFPVTPQGISQANWCPLEYAL